MMGTRRLRSNAIYIYMEETSAGGAYRFFNFLIC